MHSYYQTQFPYSPLANNGLTPLLLKEESDGRFHPTNKPFEVFENQITGFRYLRLNDGRIYRRNFTPRGQRGYIEYDAPIIAREIENFIAFILDEAPYEVTEVSRYYGDSQFYDSDAEAYIAAVELADGEPLEPAVRMVYHRFARRIKAAGLWDTTAQFTPGAGARTLAGALVPWWGSPLTNVNFVEGDYDRAGGIKGDKNTKYLQGVSGNTYGQDDFLAFVYVTEIPSDPSGNSSKFCFANESADGSFTFGKSLSGDLITSRSKGASSYTPGLTVTDELSGLCGCSRQTGANALLHSKSGTIVAPIASVSNLSNPVRFFGHTSQSRSDCRQFAFFYGPFADAEIWRTILDQFHSELSAILS